MDLLSNIAAGSVLFMIGAVTAILLFLAWLSFRNPVLMKIGLRNLVRRPAQSILIVIGMTLSTIIIISAFGTGDTLSYSVKRQAVAAYGEVDEIIAPPLLSLLASIESGQGDDAAATELEDTIDSLTAGGLESLLAFVQGGLPSLDVERLDQLRAEAEADPLIDGVAGAIVFPTILRNTSTGAGEPLGVIYAVDDQYPETFGLMSVDGKPLDMTSLQPGIGNIFLQASNLFELASSQAERLTGDEASLTARAIAGLGAIFTGVATNQLPDLSLDLATLEELGVDTAPLEAMGIQTIDLDTIATALGMSDEQADELSDTVEGVLNAISDSANQLLRAVNLNTLGYEIDRVLGQYGLQLRQGDLYLSRLAAERLGASAGDVVEIYVGPLPVRFRVRAVVDQAGPLSALVPVVMLPLEEAQQLLFMNDKVNTVLVSNKGDELSGLAHSGVVTQRLAVLAMDPAAVEKVREVLARPDVAPIVTDAAPDLLTDTAMQADEDAPVAIQNLVETIGEGLGIRVATQEEVDALLAAAAGDTDIDLREALVNTGVRSWLLDLNLPNSAHDELQTALANLNTFDVIQPLSKSTIVTAATVGGTVFSSIFSLFGGLSILAAILLIFLIFVMLAAERRSEIGMARAIGTQRRQVVQIFVTEGMVYALAASALGVLIGISVTLAMTRFIGQLFNELTGQVNPQAAGLFGINFHINWQSIVISYCLGVVLTFVVIVLASWRVSNMNIVSAIRELPDRGGMRSRKGLRGVWRWLFPALVATAGVALLAWTTPSGLYSLALLGATFVLAGGMWLVGRMLERTSLRQGTAARVVYTGIGLGLLLFWVPPWGRWLSRAAPDLYNYSQIQMPIQFLAGAVLIVVGAIMVIMVNADALGWLASRALGFIPWMRPVLKTAIAYPLNTRFRTGMTMVLFAMIMASVVVMAVVIHATQTLVQLDEQSTAGFDIEVSPTLLSFFSPVDDFGAALTAQADAEVLADVAAVGQVYREVLRARTVVRGRTDGGPWRYAGVNGLNEGYIDQAEGVYSFQARAPGYESDEAVWQALRDGEDVAIILPRKLGEGRRLQTASDAGGGDAAEPAGRRDERHAMMMNELFFTDVSIENGRLPELFVEVKANVDAGEEAPPPRRLQVIGVLADDESLAWSGIQTGADVLFAVLGDTPSEVSNYVKVREGADVREVAQGVERAFVPNGLDAVVLADRFMQGQQLMAGILQLLQGFMALGLLVGIAALGVVSTRAVVERRQQVGMLRAIGYQRRMVGLSFVLESSFISLSGLLIGALTGIVLGGLVLQSSFPEAAGSAAATPWATIAGIVFAAYLFSLLTAIVPVWQASRIYPAEALRYE